METQQSLLTENELSGAAEFLQQSDAIEGINIPIDAYLGAVLGGQAGEPTDEEDLRSYVENHSGALNYVLSNHKRLPTVHDCLEIHRRLMQNSRLGRHEIGSFRRTTVMVGGEICPNPVSVPFMMDSLCFGLTNGFDALGAHCQFEAVHPFADGNGRTGRLFWLWLRLHGGGVIAPFLEAAGFKGETFEEKRQSYYQSLREYKRAG